MAEDYKLIDNEEKHRYEFQIDGKIAEIDYIKSRQLGFRMQAFDGATLLKSTVTIDHQILCVAEQSLLNGEII